LKGRWFIIAIVLLVALFAIVVGGFLWPRPQFDRGRTPWTLNRDSLERVDSLATDSPAPTDPGSPP
jgi:hypothetical protein